MAKYLMSERTAAWVRSQMERKAPASASGATRGVSSSFAVEDEFANPYEVRFASSLGDGADNKGKWIIWLPSDGLLTVFGRTVDVTEGLNEAGSPYPSGWYVLDFLSPEGGDVYLNVSSSDGGIKASFSSTPDASEDDELGARSILISNCAENRVIATVDSAIVLGSNLDRVSIDVSTDKPSVQLKNFDNDKSDVKQGFVQRIRVVKDGEDSFHLEADGADVFIVARVNGALKYIPLTGSKDADADGVEDSPCDHPGDTPGTGTIGGVSPDDEEDHGGGGAGGVVSGGGGVGGVPAGDDTHAGEPCPDCSPKS